MTVTIQDIKRLVGLQLGLLEVSEDDRIIEDLGAESVDGVNIVAALEDKYSVEIEEEELIEIGSVKDLFELMRQKVKV